MLDQLFSITSGVAMLGWLALVAAPLNRRALVIAARIVAALLCGGYAVLLVRALAFGPGPPEGAGFGSLDGVAALFSQRGALLAGWCTISRSTCLPAAGRSRMPGGAACRTGWCCRACF